MDDPLPDLSEGVSGPPPPGVYQNGGPFSPQVIWPSQLHMGAGKQRSDHIPWVQGSNHTTALPTQPPPAAGVRNSTTCPSRAAYTPPCTNHIPRMPPGQGPLGIYFFLKEINNPRKSRLFTDRTKVFATVKGIFLEGLCLFKPGPSVRLHFLVRPLVGPATLVVVRQGGGKPRENLN